MTKYKCGHESEMILLDDCPTCFSAYLIWKDSVGYNGDKSLCWKCWNKKRREEIDHRR